MNKPSKRPFLGDFPLPNSLLSWWYKSIRRPSDAYKHLDISKYLGEKKTYIPGKFTSNESPYVCCFQPIHTFGGFLKWGYPQIIHLNRIFHEINHPAIGVALFQETSTFSSINELQMAIFNSYAKSSQSIYIYIHMYISYSYVYIIEYTAIYGNFPKWRYPQLSSILMGFSMIFNDFPL